MESRIAVSLLLLGVCTWEGDPLYRSSVNEYIASYLASLPCAAFGIVNCCMIASCAISFKTLLEHFSNGG